MDGHTPDVKKKRVGSVLESLKIASIADSTIGNPMMRGISGGEKRRLSIAMELVPGPSILVLDEVRPAPGNRRSYSEFVIMHGFQ